MHANNKPTSRSRWESEFGPEWPILHDICLPGVLVRTGNTGEGGTVSIFYIHIDAAAQSGRNPVSKHQIQPEYGDEQAGAGWDCRTRLARPNSQARPGTGKKIFSLFR